MQLHTDRRFLMFLCYNKYNNNFDTLLNVFEHLNPRVLCSLCALPLVEVLRESLNVCRFLSVRDVKVVGNKSSKGKHFISILRQKETFLSVKTSEMSYRPDWEREAGEFGPTSSVFFFFTSVDVSLCLLLRRWSSCWSQTLSFNPKILSAYVPDFFSSSQNWCLDIIKIS